ncbi:MAG: hypothetical protein HYT07_02815 [Candidatus Levybacteria bacterium]|nr:hypothetical protein [Candidatus Levybacteria bacterium]
MNKLKLFVVSILAINLIGTTIVDSRYLSKKIFFLPNGALDTTFELSSTKVKTTKDINQIKNVNVIVLKINLKNNASYPLTNMKLIVANKGIDALETPSALRFTHFPPNTSESAFKVPDLSAGSERSSEILLYARERGTYSTNVIVENDEKVKGSTDLITFTAE